MKHDDEGAEGCFTIYPAIWLDGNGTKFLFVKPLLALGKNLRPIFLW